MHGPATPPYFGNIFNLFRYKDWTLSFNVIYKLGHYFRKPSVNYYRILQFGDYIPTEYLDRWKAPGDELITDVPAFIYPTQSAAASFYQYAEINVERGDQIRLRDIRVAYKIPSRILRIKPVRSLELGGYYMGDDLLWKRNRFGLDPDYPRNEKLQPLFAIDLRIVLK